MSSLIPKEITCCDQIFDLSFHPSSNFLTTGCINGVIELWKYSVDEENELKNSISAFKSSCRGVQFSNDGESLICISSDKSWKQINNKGQTLHHNKTAHDAAINKVKILDENLFVTGDDNGVVKLWDLRTSNKDIMNWDAHTDFISDFDYFSDSYNLFSSSGDATLCVYDIRKHEQFYRSDDQESELHSVKVIKNGKKVLCGTQDGVLLIFKAGAWGDCSDRMIGHPDSVSTLWKIDESTILTGSNDGLIRVVSIHPNKILGVIADMNDISIDGLRATFDKTTLGGYSTDEIVRFWDISILIDEDEEKEESENDSDSDDDENDSENEQNDSQEGDDESSEEDKEEDSEESDNDSDKSDDCDDSDDSDDSDKHQKKKIKIPTKREIFYSDL